jgi:MSHA biogenesis protein MshP
MRLDCAVPPRQRGFGLVAALFLIVVVAGVITTMAQLSVVQSNTGSLALQQARAWQAANAGLELAIASAAKGSCPSSSPFTLPGLDGFTIQVSRCEVNETGHLDDEQQSVRLYRLVSRAEYGASGQPDYAFRQLEAVVEFSVSSGGSGG